MTLWNLHDDLGVRRATILLIAVLSGAFLLLMNAQTMRMGLGTPQEMRVLGADEGLAVRGLWNVWSQRTLDYQKAIHTGYYYYTATGVGALLVPWLGNRPQTFALGGRWWSMLQGLALIVLGTWILGTLTGWSWFTAFFPVFLALNPHLHELSSEVRIDISMLFWMALATTGLAWFLLEPTRRHFRTSAILATLAFSAKPAVAPFALFLAGVNLYQIWRDGLSLRAEWRWRAGKGLQYFLVTYALASPFTFLSSGLFFASMRSEMAATATKFTQRGVWDWVRIAGNPAYLGYGLLALGVLAALVLAVAYWRRGGTVAPGDRTLAVFVAVNGLWAIAYWAFVLIASRSFLDRYLSPAYVAFLFALAGGLVLLARRSRTWAVVAAVALAVAFLPSVPERWRVLEANRQRDLRRDQVLAPHIAMEQELRTLLRPEDPILADAWVNLDPSHFTNVNRMQRIRERYFSHQPAYLAMRSASLDRYQAFLGYDDVSAAADQERKLSAVFYSQVKNSRLYGSLEPVKTWPETGVVLYRFKAPTDAAYVRSLFQRLRAEAGLDP